MQIKKVEKKVELNVSAQACSCDCRKYKNLSADIYRKSGAASGCRIIFSAAWSGWW